MAVTFGTFDGILPAAPQAFEPTPWVYVGSDGIVTIMSPAFEMGQGG